MRRVMLVAIVLYAPSLASAQAAFDVEGWRTLLAAYATTDGGFRYAALHAHPDHRALLARVVASAGEAEPIAARDAALAFHADAYNVLVVASVIERWPIESVMRVPGFFDRARHRVAGRSLTLNELENDVLRSARFAEPRVHFVLNCASAACPPLERTPFTGSARLEARLEAASRAFVRRTTRIERGSVRVSQIFEWYAADFGGLAGVRAFVAARLEPAPAAALRDPATRLAYTPYDWALNARP